MAAITYYTIVRDGQYLDPDGNWVASADAAAAYDQRDEAVEVAAGAEVVENKFSPPVPREWDQARGCWVGDGDDNAEVASLIDATVGTTPYTR